MLYPWQTTLWSQVMVRLHQRRLPHALLLSGAAGLGKLGFARALGAALLCDGRGPDGQACGECRACLLLRAGTHPDLLEVGPEEPGKAIRIDRIRELIDYLGLTSQYGGYRVVILNPADRLNRAAANSLLKTLEEPAAGTVLLLVTARPAALLPTIRSRCQQLVFTPPAQAVALPWLAGQLEGGIEPTLLLRLSAGAPLAALDLASGEKLAQRETMLRDLVALSSRHSDPVAVAADWLKLGLEVPLYWLYNWVADMVRSRCGTSTAVLRNADVGEALQALGERVDLPRLFGLLDEILEATRLAQGQANAQLVLERLLLRFVEACGPGAAKAAARR